MTMYMMTPKQHAQIVDALSDERYVSQYSHIVEALAMLKAIQPVEPDHSELIARLRNSLGLSPELALKAADALKGKS